MSIYSVYLNRFMKLPLILELATLAYCMCQRLIRQSVNKL